MVPIWIMDIALFVGIVVGATAMAFLLKYNPGLRGILLPQQNAEPLSFRPVKISLPTFGEPREAIFRPQDYDPDLRCTGTECDHHHFQQGERFYEIPLRDQGKGAILAICVPCATTPLSPKEL